MGCKWRWKKWLGWRYILWEMWVIPSACKAIIGGTMRKRNEVERNWHLAWNWVHWAQDEKVGINNKNWHNWPVTSCRIAALRNHPSPCCVHWNRPGSYAERIGSGLAFGRTERSGKSVAIARWGVNNDYKKSLEGGVDQTSVKRVMKCDYCDSHI